MKSPSAPIGSWRTSGVAPRRSRMVFDAEVEGGARAVELVDEAHARDAVLVGLTPHRLRLRLNAGDAVEHGNRAVEHPQGTLDLDGEVDVAGRVDDVDLVVLPPTGRRGRRDRDAALLLLLHPVHRGAAVVDFTDLVVDAGVEQDALGRRRLAGIDVRHDADVADASQVRRDVNRHCGSSLFVVKVVVAGEAGITSGNGRRRGWPRPSCGCLRAS